MGRQILFHMLDQDRVSFLDFVQQRNRVVVTNFTDSSSADVLPEGLDTWESTSSKWLCLWNKDLLPDLRREYIPRSGIEPYYRVNYSLPILELSVPSKGNWDREPALTQGRLYAYAYQDHAGLRNWYEALARWLRSRFMKNPISWMSGYVGAEAYRWYESGGLLLPILPPPVNSEWRERIHSQHAPR